MKRPRRTPAKPPATIAPAVPDLIDAPELAVLCVLDHSLDVAVRALVAQHPTLIDDFQRPTEQGAVLRRAHTLCRRAAALHDSLVRYARAVREASAPHARNVSDDDVAF